MKRTNFLGHVKESYIRSAFHESGSLSDQPSSVGQRIWDAASLRLSKGLGSTTTSFEELA